MAEKRRREKLLKEEDEDAFEEMKNVMHQLIKLERKVR
jgi:hypothetical protein